MNYVKAWSLKIPALFFALIAAVLFPAVGTSQQSPRKVALVLSGGGARGAAHIGVLKVLEREGIPIHCIAGTSFGALVGALYALGYEPDVIEGILSIQNWNSILSDTPERRLTPLIQRTNSRYQAEISLRGWNPELPTGFRGGQRLTEALDVLTTSQMLQAGYDFDKLPIQFRAVATNLVDGKPYIFRRGSMSEALRASMAVPLVFTPLDKDNMLLADGGLVANLPAGIARNLGADVVIAVDASSPLLAKDKIQTFIDVVDQSISLQMEANVRESRKLADIVLQPKLDDLTYNDYDKISEIVTRGEDEANRNLEQLKKLVEGIPAPRKSEPLPNSGPAPVIDSISFRGLKKIKPKYLQSEVRSNPGDVVDPSAINADVVRLYATRLFDSIAYDMEPAGGNRYRLVFVVKETLLNSLGAGLRYDNDYNFVALAEFTARNLFDSPSGAIISSQFGGLQYHFAALRFIPSPAPFLFLEPRAEVSRLDRRDIRGENLVDNYTDKREGGSVLIGRTIFKQLEIAGGYRGERVRIDGGSDPRRLDNPVTLAGLTLRLNRDSLDSREFPHSGMILGLRVDKRARGFGSDFDYSKLEADGQRYFSVSDRSTFRIHANIGYSRGTVPFYEQFYVGGYSFAQLASRQFLGLERDEILARQIAIVGINYRRLLFSRLISFIREGYLTGFYNGLYHSTREKAPFGFNWLNGGGIGMALDTMLGPVRVTGGWAERGRFNFYVSFGPTF